MTRKDYKIIAGVLRRVALDPGVKRMVALHFAGALAEDNPNFDVEKFLLVVTAPIPEPPTSILR